MYNLYIISARMSVNKQKLANFRPIAKNHISLSHKNLRRFFPKCAPQDRTACHAREGRGDDHCPGRGRQTIAWNVKPADENIDDESQGHGDHPALESPAGDNGIAQDHTGEQQTPRGGHHDKDIRILCIFGFGQAASISSIWAPIQDLAAIE